MFVASIAEVLMVEDLAYYYAK